MLVLGSLGGPLRTALGASEIPASADAAFVTSGLMSSVAADARASNWLAKVSDATPVPTSDSWLRTLSDASGLAADQPAALRLFALAAGLDAAEITGVLAPTTDGIAGTPADVASQVDARYLTLLAEDIMSAFSRGAG